MSANKNGPNGRVPLGRDSAVALVLLLVASAAYGIYVLGFFIAETPDLLNFHT